jgi:hypothetical protein
MKRPFYQILVLITALLMLVACNREGVGGFAPAGGRVAIVRDEDRLYTTNADGGDTALITDSFAFAFGATFSPDGSVILYADQENEAVCLTLADGSGPRECVALPVEAANGGILTFLPDGDVLVGYEGEDSRFRMLILDQNWEPVHDVTGIDHFFISQNAYKEKRGEQGTEWYLKPHPSDGPLRWVIIRDDQALAYSATAAGVDGPTPLPAPIVAELQEALVDRQAGDLSSGTVSPDGNALAFRTRGSGDRYSLYVANMQQANAEVVQLVERARFRVQYAFSPDGSQIAYESDAGGRSIWIASADGSNAQQLAGATALPSWQLNGCHC